MIPLLLSCQSYKFVYILLPALFLQSPPELSSSVILMLSPQSFVSLNRCKSYSQLGYCILLLVAFQKYWPRFRCPDRVQCRFSPMFDHFIHLNCLWLQMFWQWSSSGQTTCLSSANRSWVMAPELHINSTQQLDVHFINQMAFSNTDLRSYTAAGHQSTVNAVECTKRGWVHRLDKIWCKYDFNQPTQPTQRWGPILEILIRHCYTRKQHATITCIFRTSTGEHVRDGFNHFQPVTWRKWPTLSGSSADANDNAVLSKYIHVLQEFGLNDFLHLWTPEAYPEPQIYSNQFSSFQVNPSRLKSI